MILQKPRRIKIIATAYKWKNIYVLQRPHMEISAYQQQATVKSLVGIKAKVFLIGNYKRIMNWREDNAWCRMEGLHIPSTLGSDSPRATWTL